MEEKSIRGKAIDCPIEQLTLTEMFVSSAPETAAEENVARRVVGETTSTARIPPPFSLLKVQVMGSGREVLSYSVTFAEEEQEGA